MIRRVIHRHLGTLLLGLQLLIAAAATAGCTRHQVTRMYDGVPRAGRFIHPAAYAAFLRGSEWAERGQLPQAIAELEQAVAYDADNLAAHSRLIGLYCRQRDLPAATRAYREVMERDPEHGEAHYAWARCQQQREGDPDLLAAARRAAETAPEDERAVLLLAEQLILSKRRAEAIVWLRALLRRQPGSVAGWQALKVAADEEHAAWGREAKRRHARLLARNRSRKIVAQTKPKLEQRIDQALMAGRISEARQLVRRAGSPPMLVALRALAIGKRKLAQREASLRMRAQPDDFAARSVLALVLDEQGQSEQAIELLYAAAPPQQLDPLSRRVMARLLKRHVGPEAMQHWAAATLLAPPPSHSPPSPRQGTTP